MAYDILIVDDEADIRALVSGILSDEGMEPRQAANAEAALAEVRARVPALIILDIWLQGSAIDGMQLLQTFRQDYPQVPVLMISGHGNIETAVSAIKIGAYDFIEKPFKADRLLHTLNRALEAAHLRRENAELRLKADAQPDLIGDSAAVRHLRSVIDKAAPTKSRIFIEGPAGSGKEIVARLIHLKSTRAGAPFVVLNCANVSADRFEHELFGVESATPNQPRKIGALEQAHGGTLLLDEVADMPLETQSKIVRVLQDQSFERVGGNTRVLVDVRVIASTNRDIQKEIDEGRFRQDLYYRLNVVPIRTVPLAERREDIVAFCRYFMQRFAESAGLPARVLGDDALATLQAYHWPGNIRQLRNVIEWLLIMHGHDGTPIKAESLPPEISGSAPAVLRWDKSGEIMTLPLREARELFEREYLLAQVTRFGGNISRTASFVGMERSALHRKLKILGLHSGRAGDGHEGDDVNGDDPATTASDISTITNPTGTTTASTKEDAA